MRGFIIIRSLVIITAISVLTVAASGAVFSDTFEVDENYFSSGNVDISATPEEAVVSMENMLPGDSATGTITVSNSGSIDFSYDIWAKKDAGITEFYNALNIKVEQGSSALYDGSMSEFLTLPGGQRVLSAGSSEDITITVSLPTDTTIALDGKYCKVAFMFGAEQI